MANAFPERMVLMLRRDERIRYESRPKPLPGDFWFENGWNCFALPEDAEVTLHNTQNVNGGPITITLTWVYPDRTEKASRDPAGREWMWTL